MPIFQIGELVNQLFSIGINCREGNKLLDIPAALRPYYERWLFHRDGFVRLYDENMDYIGVEDIVRMGPFYNVYFLIENQHVIENDDNSFKLLCANPYFSLNNGKVTELGWSGGVLADILTKDVMLYDFFAKSIMKEEVRKISVKVADYACIIETRVWEPTGLAAIYEVVDRIGLNIKELLKQVHLGDDIQLK